MMTWMTRTVLPALALCAGLALPGQALDLDQMSQAERTALRAEIRTYLLENPEVIMEAVAVLEQRQASAQEADDSDLVRVNAEALFEDSTSWVGGNPDGDITLVEFLDYRCGYCRRAHDDVAALLKEDGNIRFVVKEFPILGEDSVTAARFALATRAVAGDDAYKSVNDALMTFEGSINNTTLRRIGEGLGLEAERIIAQMDSDAITGILRANHALGQRLQISGTPSFVMEDRMLRGYVPQDTMAQIAAQIRAE